MKDLNKKIITPLSDEQLTDLEKDKIKGGVGGTPPSYGCPPPSDTTGTDTIPTPPPPPPA